MENKTCGECDFNARGLCIVNRWDVSESSSGCSVFRKTYPGTVFQKITASLEVLAMEFVEPYTRWGEDGHLETLWRSNFRELSGMLFDTEEEALAATVSRLKEVSDGR